MAVTDPHEPWNAPQYPRPTGAYEGADIRTVIATQLMAGLVSIYSHPQSDGVFDAPGVAKWAVECADALIEELNR